MYVQIVDDGEFYLDLGVAVLAGGASRRFGSDKALFPIDGSGPTLLERSVDAALQLSNRVAVIGHQRYGQLSLDVPVLPDDGPACGPLGGIATALRSLRCQRVMVLACDMPCLSIPLLRWMTHLETDAEVVIPQTADGTFQTMHAIYRHSALPSIEAALSAGNTAVHSFFPAVRLRIISEPEMRVFDPALDSLFGLNRPEDLLRIPCSQWSK